MTFINCFLDNLFTVTSDLMDNKSVLKSGKLRVSKKLNLNHKFQENSAVTSLEFHPTAKIAYTACLLYTSPSPRDS